MSLIQMLPPVPPDSDSAYAEFYALAARYHVRRQEYARALSLDTFERRFQRARAGCAANYTAGSVPALVEFLAADVRLAELIRAVSTTNPNFAETSAGALVFYDRICGKA